MDLSKNQIIGIIMGAILLLTGIVGLSMGLSNSIVTGARISVNGLVSTSKNYLAIGEGNYNGVTATAAFGYPLSSVATADGAVYKYGELLQVDSTGAITVQNSSGQINTYTAIPMLTDSDSSGNIDNSDSVANAAAADGQVYTMIDGTKAGVFVKVQEGNNTNGGIPGEMVMYVSVATGSPLSTADKAKFEAGFKSSDSVTVINGVDPTDGALILVVKPR